VISPYARRGYIDHQVLSSDAYPKFIEDDFLNGARLNPGTDGRPDPRPDVREDEPILGNLVEDFDFDQAPRFPVLLATNPPTDVASASSSASPKTRLWPPSGARSISSPRPTSQAYWTPSSTTAMGALSWK
jgi:hypothetical protein